MRAKWSRLEDGRRPETAFFQVFADGIIRLLCDIAVVALSYFLELIGKALSQPDISAWFVPVSRTRLFFSHERIFVHKMVPRNT